MDQGYDIDLPKKDKNPEIDLLMRKGVYPCEYMDKLDRFAKTRLPPMNAFKSRLNKTEISRGACTKCVEDI